MSNLIRRNPACLQLVQEPIVPEQNDARGGPGRKGPQRLACSTSNIVPTEGDDDVNDRETPELRYRTVLRQRIGDVESRRGCRKHEIYGNHRKQPRASEDGATPEVDQKEAERAAEYEKSVGTRCPYLLERADYQGNHGTRKTPRRRLGAASKVDGRDYRACTVATEPALWPLPQPAASGAAHTARPNQGP